MNDSREQNPSKGKYGNWDHVAHKIPKIMTDFRQFYREIQMIKYLLYKDAITKTEILDRMRSIRIIQLDENIRCPEYPIVNLESGSIAEIYKQILNCLENLENEIDQLEIHSSSELVELSGYPMWSVEEEWFRFVNALQALFPILREISFKIMSGQEVSNDSVVSSREDFELQFGLKWITL